MSKSLSIAILTVGAAALIPATASAQYYAPKPAPVSNSHHPGGAGIDLGFRDKGIHPNAGVGISRIGVGAGAGVGLRHVGAGANAGIGPLGASTDAGLGRNGLGARASAGIGQTGAAAEAGWSKGGLGLGASAKVLGFGAGASAGFGDRGPGVGASLAFGDIGTLVIGSHRNSYPGAQQTMSHMYPNQRAKYYRSQTYGNAPYYKAPSPQYQPYQSREKTRGSYHSQHGQSYYQQQPQYSYGSSRHSQAPVPNYQYSTYRHNETISKAHSDGYHGYCNH